MSYTDSGACKNTETYVNLAQDMLNTSANILSIPRVDMSCRILEVELPLLSSLLLGFRSTIRWVRVSTSDSEKVINDKGRSRTCSHRD